MLLALNYRDSQPIYSQIRDELRKLITAGALEPGEELPSVRDMSMGLAVNPNTIQRAYAELEAEGFIHSVPGKGRFARQMGGPDTGRTPDAGNREELMGQLHKLLVQLRSLDVSTAELIAVMKEVDADD